MKFLDLLQMSIQSLWKRKVRTVLTVLGVVIGTASIVVMVSLGLGLNKSTMDMIEQYGGLTTIDVYSNNGGGVYYFGDMTEDTQSQEVKYLDDALVDMIRQMDYVEDVYPILSTSVIAKYGNYNNHFEIQGMSKEAIINLNVPLSEGTLPDGSDGVIDLLYGNMILTGFYNEKTHQGFWDGNGLQMDLMSEPLFIIFDTDAYYQSQWNDSTTPVTPPKKYTLLASGLIAGAEDEWTAHSYAAYCDLEELKAHLQIVFKNKVIPGQPTMTSGKPYKELFYNMIKVNVEDMKYMTDVQKLINDMGYRATSNAEWIASQQEQAGYVQAVLGGIGAVSLLVAAIGITNTMMMSIYERTKEIGIIKVLGCDMRNIRMQFLLEAGYIGFLGGVVGVLLSYGISYLINQVVATSGMGMSTLSYIPLWLSLASVAFAVAVGMVAGFFPAQRAMKLSPLAAIRNE
ncbi:MAG: ABC transporter permease [Eubacteriales bacterium]